MHKQINKAGSKNYLHCLFKALSVQFYLISCRNIVHDEPERARGKCQIIAQ